MIGIPENKQPMPESGKKELFSADITYMASGEYAFACYCFTRTGKADLPTLYNRALCCYHLSLHEECRPLLLEAERLLPSSAERPWADLPETVIRWEHEESPFLCPMPADAPGCIAAVQLLRLKAEVSAKLRLSPEVRTIHARLGSKYQHIEELIKKYSHEIQRHIQSLLDKPAGGCHSSGIQGSTRQ